MRVPAALLTCMVVTCWVRPLLAHDHVLRKRGLFGPRPPGTACAFDPCGIAGFCSGGRHCELDAFCRHHCTCTEDSSHELCVDSTPSAGSSGVTTPSPVVCAFNPCTIPNFCGTGRSCELDKQCRYSCVCTDDSMHEMCTPITDSPSDPPFHLTESVTEMTPLAATDSGYSDITNGGSCPSGFPCENGGCELVGSAGTLGIRCVCHDGWAGLACNKEKLTECNKVCDDGFMCVFISNLVEVCVAQTPEVPDDKIISADDNSTNVCSSEYRHRNASERMCRFGLSCRYGVCVEAGRGTSVGTDGGAGSRCDCDVGASGPVCSNTCCLDCGAHGDCLYTKGADEMCNCHTNYSGPHCTLLAYTAEPYVEATWYWWVVGVCAVVLVALLLLMVVVPYLMWRHRVIIVMKVVHFFQGYEDDDEREWDVFVSYKSCQRDEKFVVHTLMPRLECQLGFKLNVHFRDFIPGANISDNIVNAVKGSRRTILLITPEYVTSEWTRFEYNVAQQEMMNRKNRIIPILLDDISDCMSDMDPTLKTILRSVTYITYPADVCDDKAHDKFWKRVQLTMPKKRTSDECILSSTHSESIEVSVINSGKGSNGYVQKLPNNTDTEEIYATINEADLDIRFKNEKNKLYSDKYIPILNGYTHC